MNLHDGEDHLHHHDGSHRWGGGPPHMAIEKWHEIVRKHMDEHRATAGRTDVAVDPVPRLAVANRGWPVHPNPPRGGGSTVMNRRGGAQT